MADTTPDLLSPLSAEEIEEVRVSNYPSLPTFNREDWSIASSDIPALCAQLRWIPRTSEQMEAYRKYWDQHFDGRISFEHACGILEQCHLPGPYIRELVTVYNKKKDGFVAEGDFALFHEILHKHYNWDLNYEEFVQEADINLDKKVSIDEAVAWAEKKASLQKNLKP